MAPDALVQRAGGRAGQLHQPRTFGTEHEPMKTSDQIGTTLDAWVAGQYVLVASDLAPYVSLALEAIRRPYPYHLSVYAACDEDIAPAGRLTPAFAGAFDWHSAVHSHWTLVRCVTRFPGAPWADESLAQLEASLTQENVNGECRFLAARPTFERPYGLAWLLCLQRELDVAAEAHAWAAPLASQLRPLSRLGAGHLASWLPKLSFPVRSGVHSQTAFALGLTLDWAERSPVTGDAELRSLVRLSAQRFYGSDERYPLHLEPSGEDFLSASLGAADLMRRVLSPSEFTSWIVATLKHADAETRWLEPVEVRDRRDGRISHLDGLHLSRAFMLLAISETLIETESHTQIAKAFQRSAIRQATAGLEAIASSTYAGTHWLGSFAVYLLTRAWSSGSSSPDVVDSSLGPSSSSDA